MTQNIYKGGQQVNQNGVLEYTYPFFEVYWNNAYWRGVLWPNLPAILTDEIKELKKIDFKQRVSSYDPLLYNFINVK
jgi:hypothetical protein